MKTEHEEYLITDNLFRVFIRSHYKGIQLSNSGIDLIGKEFAEYLDDLNLTDKQKKNILPESEADVIINMQHPLRMKGFPPAYVLHFTEFVAKIHNEAD